MINFQYVLNVAILQAIKKYFSCVKKTEPKTARAVSKCVHKVSRPTFAWDFSLSVSFFAWMAGLQCSGIPAQR